MGLIVTAFPPTNFKFLACHQNLSIRNDGGREAVLQSVSCECIKDIKGVKQRIYVNQELETKPDPHHVQTLIADTKESTLLCVTTEPYQHLIGCAAGWVVGLSIRKHT